jgi:hypothetical protein
VLPGESAQRRRSGDASGLIDRCIEWAEANGAADGWFREALAETYARAGDDGRASREATIALARLEAGLWLPPSAFASRFLPDSGRVARLRELAGT